MARVPRGAVGCGAVYRPTDSSRCCAAIHSMSLALSPHTVGPKSALLAPLDCPIQIYCRTGGNRTLSDPMWWYHSKDIESMDTLHWHVRLDEMCCSGTIYRHSRVRQLDRPSKWTACKTWTVVGLANRGFL